MATKSLTKIDTFLDQLATLRIMRDESAAAAKVAKDACDKLEEQLLNSLLDSGLETTGNANLLVSVKRTDVPQVDDWAAFWKFVVANDAGDMVQRRISSPAWKARVADGVTVPGVTVFKKIELAVRSRDGKV